jgi:hypothetical protein
VRRPNPAYCLNHDETASERTCADCRCAFCAACVVTLQGRTLCGPCKNFRVRGLNRPSRLAPLALIAFLLALVSGPVAFILSLIAVGTQATGSLAGAVFLCGIALALPAVALVLGGLALREIENRPNVGGRSLAASGAAAGLAGVVLALGIAVLMIAKQWQG